MDYPPSSELTVLAWAIAAIWAVLVVVFIGACRKRSTLRPLAGPCPSSDLPKLTVVVAAKPNHERGRQLTEALELEGIVELVPEWVGPRPSVAARSTRSGSPCLTALE